MWIIILFYSCLFMHMGCFSFELLMVLGFVVGVGFGAACACLGCVMLACIR